MAGRSRPAADWAFIHPGPSDTWAGNRRHPFRIEFDLPAPPRFPCRLDVALVDAQEGGATVEVAVNGIVFAYVFDNYWDTNYRAAQGGDLVFSLVLDLRSGCFDPGHATRFGWQTLGTVIDLPRAVLAIPGDSHLRQRLRLMPALPARLRCCS